MTNVIYIQNEDDLSSPTEYIRTVKIPRVETDDSNMVEEHISLEVTDPSELEEMQDRKIFVQKRTNIEETIEVEEEGLTESYTIEEKDEGLQFSRQYEPTENLVQQQDLDSDDKFLLSLSPALKRLSAKKNFLARIKIQQLLFEIEFDEKYDKYS